MNKLKLAISGIGGVGGYYGGLLASHYANSADINIYFIARGKNLEAIRQHGLKVRTSDNEFTAIPTLATDQPTDIGKVDFLFCCTKAYDLEENITQLLPVIGTETVIIPLLNGVDIAGRIQQVLPGHHIWEGCCYIVSRLEEPGIIEKTSPKDFLYFGSKNGDEMRQRLLLSLLTEAGISAYNPDDIDIRIWMKFVMISTTATITSYYNLSIGGIMQGHYDEFLELLKEIRRVAEAKGIHLPDDIVESTAKAQQLMPHDSTTSMHSDFMRGGRNELETLTGYVIRAAESLHINVPLYRKMYDQLSAGINR